MKNIIMTSLVLMSSAILMCSCCGTGKQPAAAKEVAFVVYDSHFESNQSGLQGDVSCLAFSEFGAFSKIFGTVPPLMNQKERHPVTEGVFKGNQVVAIIHRGDKMWTYQVSKVTVAGQTLNVCYAATPGTSSTARFAVPLIVSVPQGNYSAVQFVENGKTAGTASFSQTPSR